MRLFAAPLQGYTEAPWRHFHSLFFGGADEYVTPFIRIENGTVRNKDSRDLTSFKDDNTVPQIIFKDFEEFLRSVNFIRSLQFTRIDLNLGCPFPPQVNRGRGSGTIADTQLLERVGEYINSDSANSYSIKMRLGVKEPDEWKNIIGILNSMNLSHICVHPRTARQQYSGVLCYDQFESFLTSSKNRIVFNGEIRTPEDISAICSRYPQLHGIMSGRGLLGRPTLFYEWINGNTLNIQERTESIVKLHKALYDYYSSNLCGSTQILSKIKPFWEYAGADIDRKVYKMIKKATTIDKYLTAVASIVRK